MGGKIRSAIFWTLLLSLSFSLAGNRVIFAQAETPFTEVATTIDFGNSITFQASLQLDTTPQEAYLIFQPEGQETETITLPPGDGQTLTYTLDLNQHPLRAFSQVSYSYRLRLSDGRIINSPSYQFEYSDTRFQWMQLENPLFQVFWYDRDLAFGQLVINTAQTGFQSANQLLPLQIKQKIRIYIYNSPADMKATRTGSQPWVTGQAAPDLGVIVLTIPQGPEERLELERQLPHELMHILIYQLMGEKTSNLPAWLVEGLASNTEPYANPEYERVLLKSAEEGKLIPITALCSNFPQDASSAFLAYAESASFVRFLHRTYGSSAIRWLIERYNNGVGCSEGIETALNKPLSQLEYRWKQEELHLNTDHLIFQNLLPFILLVGILFGAISVTILVASKRFHPTSALEEK
ncbi:peptidase MA superfamily [Anaerolinea thermolimosa]|uniref:peptidase MA family metallohydrolase n=1 Tax=Anaerolinea thermolimosa TaxID=229919 RepID=UPI000780EF52|nr:peptidase MA family metallohydrolase [Anaerolinea thermolimosa]GAP06743.1 peptidase MA superfamily [Anaerolinea thermolimosa]